MKKMYTNNSKHIEYPGGLSVRPGESRMIDECFVKSVQPKLFKVEDILGLSVKKAIAEIDNLSDEHLVLVIEAEEATDKPRKGVLNAFGDALELRQAAYAHEIVLEQLEALDDSELQEKLLDDGYSEDDKSIIQSVLDDRLSALANDASEEGSEEGNEES